MYGRQKDEHIDSPEKQRKARTQHVLEDFGFHPKMQQRGKDDEGLGAGAFVNSLDHSDLRLRIQTAINEIEGRTG